jgi:hypothetical protein
MKGLYKYQTKQHNDGLLEVGSIRVGTLYDFRRQDHKAGIADSFEGKKIVSHELGVFSSNEYNPIGFKALKEFGIADAEGVQDFTMGPGFILERVVESQNCFIYCMSSVLSNSMFDEFEGAETCVCIENIRSFFWRLTYSLDQVVPVDFKGLFEVIYTDEPEEWNFSDWGAAPANIKTMEFSSQYEVRAIWTPKNNVDIQPQILKDKKLRRYVRQCMPDEIK